MRTKLRKINEGKEEEVDTSPDIQLYEPSQADRDRLNSFLGFKASGRSPISSPVTGKEESYPTRIKGTFTNIGSGARKDADEEDDEVTILPSIEQKMKDEDHEEASSRGYQGLPASSKSKHHTCC